MKKLLFNIYYLLLPNQLAQIANSKLKIVNLLCVFVLLVLFTAPGDAAAQDLPAEADVGLDSSVVMIRSVGQDFDYSAPWKQKMMTQGLGSGFVIEGGRVLTNAHNVSNNKYLELQKENVAKKYPAKVAFLAHDCDLALLTIDDPTFFDDTVALDLAGIPQLNTTVSTYGFPVGGRRISVTEGVVSRVQMDAYAHTRADSHLVIQTDAAINPGNSGGPVIQNGKVVGVAFQGLRQAENIGYMIPTTVIKHFLTDIEDGKYDGFGSLGVILYPGLHSPGYKAYLNVPPDAQGVVVIQTLMHSSAESILRPGDVLTRIDDYDIDNDGRVEIYGLRLGLSEAVETRQIGETVRLSFYRQGKLTEAAATVALNRPVFEYARQYDKTPRYVCFAGLVFVPATRNLLETAGPDWLENIPFELRYLFQNSIQLNTDRQRKEYVVLSKIMPDEANAYAAGFKSQVLESVNGAEIHSLDDVYHAFEQPVVQFYTIRFMSVQRPLIIDAALAETTQQLILKKYDIPEQAMLEPQP